MKSTTEAGSQEKNMSIEELEERIYAIWKKETFDVLFKIRNGKRIHMDMYGDFDGRNYINIYEIPSHENVSWDEVQDHQIIDEGFPSEACAKIREIFGTSILHVTETEL